MIIENGVVIKITDADVAFDMQREEYGVLNLPDEATVLKADVTGISPSMRSNIKELRGKNIQYIEAFTDHCGERSSLTPTFPALELFDMPSLKEIPKEAFVQHKMLKKVDLPSVKYVREMAFEDSSIETVILPEAMTIYESAFNFSNISSIYADKVEIIEERAFDECKKLDKLHMLNVRLIGKYAFQNCNKLRLIYFAKVTNIDDTAFMGCKSLEEANLPSVQSIGEIAFSNCKKLSRVHLGDDLKAIQHMAFYSCAITNLKIGKAAIVEAEAFENIQKDVDVYCDVPEQIDGAFGFFPNGRKVKNVYFAKKYTERQKLPFLTSNECSYLVFPNKRMRALSVNTSQVFEVEQEISCIDGKTLWILRNGCYAVKETYGKVIKYCSGKEELEKALNAPPF